MDISVIIVNYNVKYFLEQCLHSVIKASVNIKAEIFVVDNYSTDGSREYLEHKFPAVNFFWNVTNDGFAKANNSAIGKTSGEYVLFLNPDTILPEDCFEKCIAFFKANEQCGALGVRMIDGSGKFLKESKRSFPSPATSFYKITGLTALFPSSKLFARYYAGNLSETANNEVDVLAGAFMMLKRNALTTVKGFDEDYFMYGEDIDLSYRIQKMGFKNYYFAGTSIIHFKGESTQKRSYNYIRRFYDAMKMFVNKHYKAHQGTRLLMIMSIGLSKMIAMLGLFLKRTFTIRPVSSKAKETAIIAGQQRFDKMIHLVRYSSIPIVIKGRIAIDNAEKGIAIGRISELNSLLKKTRFDQLIFCEGELSFQTIIEKLQEVPASVDCFFHAKGSNSIVGSSSKNEKGFFIAKA